MTNKTTSAIDLDRLTYRVANAKLGEGPAVRCEVSTEYEIGIAREWVKRVLASLENGHG